MQHKHPQHPQQPQFAAKLLAGLVAMALCATAWSQAGSPGAGKGGSAGAAATKGAPRISGNVVKIGVLTDMSGLYADLGGEGSVIIPTPIGKRRFKSNLGVCRMGVIVDP
jgi:hypothetical protein